MACSLFLPRRRRRSPRIVATISGAAKIRRGKRSSVSAAHTDAGISAEDDFELRPEQDLTALVKMVDFRWGNDGSQQDEKALLGGGVEDLLEILHQLKRIFLQMVLV